MKSIILISAALLFAAFSSGDARAADVEVHPGAGVAINAPGLHIDTAAPDAWRYKYDNNRWWYYTPENRWMYYSEPGGWTYYQPGYTTYYGPTTVAPAAPTYSYSYVPGYTTYYPSVGVFYGYRYPYGRGVSWGRGWRGGGGRW